MKDNTAPSKRTVKKGGNFIPAFCNLIGTFMILAVIITCLPLTIPKYMGYEVFSVVSGSMEPAIPVGSVIYVEGATAREVEPGTVIAFHSGDVVVTHRVVENRTFMGEFVTKGDANMGEDMSTVPYADLIGVVVKHYPYVGRLLAVYTSNIGKAYVLAFAACGLMFNILAGRLRDRQRDKLREQIEKNL